MGTETSSLLTNLSEGFAKVVLDTATSVVRVDDGSRLTATGIVWKEDGVIATTSHGVERDENLSIELDDGTRHSATIVGRDPTTDLAVLTANATGLSPIKKSNSDDVRVGHIILALGRPGDSGLHATIGIISARHESQSGGQNEYILYTDADLYPGFSGGPLVNVIGDVVGITNRMFGRGTGVALGIPIITRVVDELLQHGRVRRGYLGIGTQPVVVQESLRKALNIGQERALLIVQVKAGSSADQTGLMIGDILLSINDKEVQDVDDLRGHLQAGKSITLRILRGGEVCELIAAVGIEE